jgi:ATP-dependent Clp protease ATP-binding subunit ClpA
MDDQFTPQARRVMQRACDEAQRLNHDYLGTEHVLLGLLREGTSQAARVLSRLGVELRTLRLHIEQIGPGGRFQVLGGKLPRSSRLRWAIESATQQAAGASGFVGPGHLLLALLGDEESTAAQLLLSLGLRPQDVQAALRNELADENIHRAQEDEHLQGSLAPAEPDAGLSLQLPDPERSVTHRGLMARFWHFLLHFLDPDEPVGERPPDGAIRVLGRTPDGQGLGGGRP